MSDRNIIADGPKAGRQRCCIMGCGRTYKDEGYEMVMCGKHWKTAPAFMRQRHASLRRRYKNQFGDTAFWSYPAGSEKRLAAVRLAQMVSKAWDLCHRAVRDRSMGI